MTEPADGMTVGEDIIIHVGGSPVKALHFAALAAALVLVLSAAGTAQAITSLTFFINGDTYTQPFAITNSSTAGEKVIRFQLDLSPVSMVFDPVDNGPPFNNTLGTPFTPTGGSGTTTGLVTPVSLADGASLLDLTFTDFDVGETFSWDVDVDGASGSPVSVYGDDLIGAIALIDFNNGERLSGLLAAVPGNSDASEFTVTGRSPTPDDNIPEPVTAFGLTAALAGLGGYLRRRRSVA